MDRIVEFCVGHVHVHGERRLHCDTSLLPNSSVHFGNRMYVCHHLTKTSSLTHIHTNTHIHDEHSFALHCKDEFTACSPFHASHLFLLVLIAVRFQYDFFPVFVVVDRFPSFIFVVEFFQLNFRLARYENVICHFPILSFVFRMQSIDMK